MMKFWFTEHMRYFGAINWVISLYFLKNLKNISGSNKLILFSTNFLFAYGAIIGILISGSNVTIPAHYHGCIISITIIIMAKLGELLNNIQQTAKIIVFLTLGQVMHITGLALSGGYGIARKTPGEAGFYLAKFYMSIMGIGGLIAIIGGICFVLSFIFKFRHSNYTKLEH